MKLKKLFTSLAVAAATVCLAVVMSVSAGADYPSSTGQNDSTSGQETGQGQDQGQGQQGGNQQPGSPSYSGSGSGGSGGAVIHFFYLPDSGASGRMDDVTVSNESVYMLPDCTFTPPEGMGFYGWVVYDGVQFPGYNYRVGKDHDYYIQAVFSDQKAIHSIEYITVTFDNGLASPRHQSYTKKIKNSNYKKSTGSTPYEAFVLPEPEFRPIDNYYFEKWDDERGSYSVSKDVNTNKQMCLLPFGTKTVTVYANMKQKINISSCYVTIDYGDTNKRLSTYCNYYYTGNAVIPKYTVTYRPENSYVLKEGVDFTATYSNNVNAGTKAKITLTGINGYYGTVTEYFTINPLPLYSLLNDKYKSAGIYATKTLTDKSYTSGNTGCYVYTGNVIKPNVRIKVYTPDNTFTLPSSLFTFKYDNSTEIGSHKVVFEPKNTSNISAEGKTLKIKYNIVPPQQNITSAKIVNDNSSFNGQLLIYFTKLTKKLNNIEIQVSYDSKFASDQTNKYTVSGKDFTSKYIKLSSVWKNLRKYIRIRYAIEKDGTTYYGKWSKTFTVL